MPIIHPAALERDLLRGMRPDAHRYIRADWRHQVKPGSDLWSLYERFERNTAPTSHVCRRVRAKAGNGRVEMVVGAAEATTRVFYPMLVPIPSGPALIMRRTARGEMAVAFSSTANKSSRRRVKLHVSRSSRLKRKTRFGMCRNLTRVGARRQAPMKALKG